MTAIRHCSSRVRKGTSTQRACCSMRVPRLISGVRVIGRRLGLRVPLGTSTWRRYWWSEVLIAVNTCIGGTPPLLFACRQRNLDAMRLCLERGADVNWANTAGLRFCMTPAKTVTSTRRGCCWTKARRSIGR